MATATSIPVRPVRTGIALDIPRQWACDEMRPDPGCHSCNPNLFGRVATPLGASCCEQRLAALFRMAGQHVHTRMTIGGHEADVALLRTPVQVVVEYDGGWVHTMARTVENEAAQRVAWESRGWLLVRLRDPGLSATGPLDLCLPRGFTRMKNPLISNLITEHVLRCAGVTRLELARTMALMSNRIDRLP